MAPLHAWCRVRLLDDRGRVALAWTVSGPGAPDLELVERLARLRLAAKRGGWSLLVTEVSPDLAELLDLAGLVRLVDTDGDAQP